MQVPFTQFNVVGVWDICELILLIGYHMTMSSVNYTPDMTVNSVANHCIIFGHLGTSVARSDCLWSSGEFLVNFLLPLSQMELHIWVWH